MAKKTQSKKTEVSQQETVHEEIELKKDTKQYRTAEYSIVIPYVKERTSGDELRYILRSIERNLSLLSFNIVVVGDREEWFNDENVISIELPVYSENNEEDIIHKIKEVLISEMVSENIIFWQTAIYGISRIELCDIQTLKMDSFLANEVQGNTYAENKKRTIDLLGNYKLPFRNFEVKMPVFYQKEKLISLFEAIPELNENGYLFASVYFNFHYPKHKAIQTDWRVDSWVINLISSNPPIDLFNNFVAQKRFISHSEQGYSSLLIDYLSDSFKEISKYEIE